MRWTVVLIAAAVTTATGLLVPFFVRGYGPLGKGGGGPSPVIDQLPAALTLVGVVGIMVGVTGIARSRPSWRRLSVVSVACGALALLLEGPFPWWPGLGLGYVGIWLGGLLSLVAIGTAIGALIRPKRNRAVDVWLAVAGLLAGLACALLVTWILLLTVGGGGE